METGAVKWQLSGNFHLPAVPPPGPTASWQAETAGWALLRVAGDGLLVVAGS